MGKIKIKSKKESHFSGILPGKEKKSKKKRFSLLRDFYLVGKKTKIVLKKASHFSGVLVWKRRKKE